MLGLPTPTADGDCQRYSQCSRTGAPEWLLVVRDAEHVQLSAGPSPWVLSIFAGWTIHSVVTGCSSTRRGAIQLLGTATLAGLAGCGVLDTPSGPNERPPSSLGISPQRATDGWLYPAGDAGHTAHVVSSPPTTPEMDWHRVAATDGVVTSKRRPIDWRTRSVLLDTTFLIDLMNGDPDAVAKAQEPEANLVQQRLSAMTLFESYCGVAPVAVDDQPWRA